MSGSFAPPNSGFTFDQQATPAGAVRGNTWRERNVNNDIVEEWFWNGTYWLTIQRFADAINNVNFTSGANNDFVCSAPTANNVFVEAGEASANYAATHNGANFFTFTFRYLNGATAVDLSPTANSSAVVNNQVNVVAAVVNTHILRSVVSGWRITPVATGTPGTTRGAMKITYRLARL